MAGTLLLYNLKLNYQSKQHIDYIYMDI